MIVASFVWRALTIFICIFVSTELRAQSGQERQTEAFRYLSSLQHVFLDAREEGLGNGEIAAAYLVATNLLYKQAYPGRITFISSARGKDLILRMSSGDKRFAEQVDVLDPSEVSRHFGIPVDLAIRVAAESSRYLYESSIDKSFNHSQVSAGLQFKENTAFVVLPLFGNPNGPRYGGLRQTQIMLHSKEFFLENPGFNRNEIGIYEDIFAQRLRGLPPLLVRQKLLKRLFEESHLDPDIVQKLQAVLEEPTIAIAFLAGPSPLWNSEIHRHLHSQLEDYLLGLAESASDKPVVVYSTHFFDFSGWKIGPANTETQYLVIGPDEELPAPSEMKPGQIYLVSLRYLPHAEFVYLMAASDFPVIGDGDIFLSLALQLDRVFGLYHSSPYASNHAQMKKLLTRALETQARYSEKGDAVFFLREFLSGRFKWITELVDPKYRVIRAYQQVNRKLPWLMTELYSSLYQLRRIFEYQARPSRATLLSELTNTRKLYLDRSKSRARQRRLFQITQASGLAVSYRDISSTQCPIFLQRFLK